MIPMGIWFAGLVVALGCALWNCPQSRHFARRMFGQLPVFMALGINFGIVPLLFLQTTYYKSFYTATILMAWHWLAVIPILIVGYYSLYLAAFSRKETDGNARNCRMIGFGMLASLCLIAIGILITNGLTLMVRSDLWPGIMERTGHFGATTGLANNMRDPGVWLRLATMFGLGLGTTAVWALLDSHFLSPARDSETSLAEYRNWTLRLALPLALLSLILVLGVAVFGERSVVRAAYPGFSLVAIPLGFNLILVILARFGKIASMTAAILTPVMQALALALFGIVRQIGQNAGTASYMDVTKIPTDVQWTPLVAFLIAFVFGLVVIAWMVKQCVFCREENQSPEPS